MKIWQFKVAGTVWKKNWGTEFLELEEGYIFTAHR